MPLAQDLCSAATLSLALLGGNIDKTRVFLDDNALHALLTLVSKSYLNRHLHTIDVLDFLPVAVCEYDSIVG